MPSTHSETDQLTRQLIEQVATDKTSGASKLARQALQLLLEFVEQTPEQDPAELKKAAVHLALRLQSTRPSMVAIANLISLWLERIQPIQPPNADALRMQITRHTNEIIRHSRESVTLAAAQAARIISAGDTIFTHSYSSTVAALFDQLKDIKPEVIVTESQPGCEGALLAQKLATLDISVNYITDAQMGLFVKNADHIIVGADAILADGTLVNKSGTYLLALAARDQGKPFYFCCEGHKRCTLSNSEFTLEQGAGLKTAPENDYRIRSHNIYFDTTPAHLITGWFNEKGYIAYDKRDSN